MARISSEERAKRKEVYDATILNLFWNEGWNAVTYDRLAKELSITKSTLQNYYPSRLDFSKALQGKVFPKFFAYLNLDSREQLVVSWTKALSQPEFLRVLNMFITSLIQESTHKDSLNGLKKLEQVLTTKLGPEAEKDLELLLGRTVIRLGDL
ncbi:TetR family transcriptional regulator [Vibrio sp. HENC-03]|uniref:TetR family transcriptional regulator n=1 Tax=Vibrio sp. HENC-03 TaxID=992012 RepID=UPI00028DADEB|nr:TetR family transcriptional regulator [Vibrio sp. HENC-03]EKM24550.1 bacterial regulatory s, tetR family protein [Vibrio sp. HENC-03]